jgi:hypothetical protein
MSNTELPIEAPPEPLFKISLEENGGIFEPRSLDEVSEWLEREAAWWAWVIERQYGGHDYNLRQAHSQLHQAKSYTTEARRHVNINQQQYESQIQALHSTVCDIFINRKLPHSSTPIARQIEAFRKQHGNQAASFYASTFIPPPPNNPFQANEIDGWVGAVLGIVDKFTDLDHLGSARYSGAASAFEVLRIKLESLYTEKTPIYDALHRDLRGLSTAARAAYTQQSETFINEQQKRAKEFADLCAKHEKEMTEIKRLFKENLALRAPVEYWETKGKRHHKNMWLSGAFAVFSLIGAPSVLSYWIHDLLKNTPVDKAPESWRLATLALVSLFVVWAVRLLVRIYLSQTHLATDAAERVVMAKTYLALLEGEKLPEQTDRQLILQALFRPASDGIVKDEGIPPSFLEMLTRTPGKG